MHNEEKILLLLEQLVGDVAGLKTGLIRLEVRFDTLEEKFDALETRFGALETKVNAIETRLDAVEGEA